MSDLRPGRHWVHTSGCPSRHLDGACPCEPLPMDVFTSEAPLPGPWWNSTGVRPACRHGLAYCRDCHGVAF